MTVEIRALTPDAWKEVSAMRLQALRECPGMFGALLADEEKRTHADWQDFLRQNGKCFFGLFDCGELIGITGVVTDWNDSTGGYLIASYLLPVYRRKGLSDHFYQARLAWAKGHKAWKRLRVSHRDGNEASRRASQRHGFVFIERRPKVWPDGSAGDEMVYELDLEKVRNEHGAAI